MLIALQIANKQRPCTHQHGKNSYGFSRVLHILIQICCSVHVLHHASLFEAYMFEACLDLFDAFEASGSTKRGLGGFVP